MNQAGCMVARWWLELGCKFPRVLADAHVVMPDHFHGVVLLTGQERDLPPISLPAIVQWFKTMTTNEYLRGVRARGWKPFDERLWQRGYYDRIVRNDDELRRIREYIATNPIRWTLQL